MLANGLSGVKYTIFLCGNFFSNLGRERLLSGKSDGERHIIIAAFRHAIGHLHLPIKTETEPSPHKIPWQGDHRRSHGKTFVGRHTAAKMRRVENDIGLFQ